MHHPRSLIVALLAIMLLIAACGGGGGSTNAPGQTQAGSGQSPVANATEPPMEETQEPVATPGGDPGPGNDDACGLLTVSEVEAATGRANVEAQPVPEGDTDAISACGFVSDGVLPVIIASILDPENTNTDPTGYLALPGSVEIPVNGARAAFVPAAGYMLFVFKGDRVAAIAIMAPGNEDFEATARVLAQPVADRM